MNLKRLILLCLTVVAHAQFSDWAARDEESIVNGTLLDVTEMEAAAEEQEMLARAEKRQSFLTRARRAFEQVRERLAMTRDCTSEAQSREELDNELVPSEPRIASNEEKRNERRKVREEKITAGHRVKEELPKKREAARTATAKDAAASQAAAIPQSREVLFAKEQTRAEAAASNARAVRIRDAAADVRKKAREEVRAVAETARLRARAASLATWAGPSGTSVARVEAQVRVARQQSQENAARQARAEAELHLAREESRAAAAIIDRGERNREAVEAQVSRAQGAVRAASGGMIDIEDLSRDGAMDRQEARQVGILDKKFHQINVDKDAAVDLADSEANAAREAAKSAEEALATEKERAGTTALSVSQLEDELQSARRESQAASAKLARIKGKLQLAQEAHLSAQNRVRVEERNRAETRARLDRAEDAVLAAREAAVAKIHLAGANKSREMDVREPMHQITSATDFKAMDTDNDSAMEKAEVHAATIQEKEKQLDEHISAVLNFQEDIKRDVALVSIFATVVIACFTSPLRRRTSTTIRNPLLST